MAVTYDDLQNAFLFLFGRRLQGGGIHIVPDEALLKKTFHQQALRWHPDRNRFTGNDAAHSAEMFKKISNAYEILRDIAGRKVNIISNTAPAPRPQPGPAPNSAASMRKPRSEASSFWNKGRLPQSKLRFAQYLFYKGVIDWNTIVEALVWQKKNRPMVGRIGLDFNYFESSSIGSVLSERSLGTPFCRAAVGQGVITNYQASAIMGRQRQYKAPIGRFFTEAGIITPYQLDAFLEELAEYNMKFR